MSLLDIHVLGSPILRQDTERVEQFTPELRRLVDDMFDTMDKAKGVGLAAPQVGRRERLAVVEVDETRLVVINPEIILKEGSVRGEEGCLSIPEVYADVDRFSRVIVRAQDIDGVWYEVEGTELLGRCLQHEIDHLHGRRRGPHQRLVGDNATGKRDRRLRFVAARAVHDELDEVQLTATDVRSGS